MATGPFLDAVGEVLPTHQASETHPAYRLLSEIELIQLVVDRSVGPHSRTMVSTAGYSDRAFILQTAAHNQLIHEDIPPGSFVMIDPRVEIAEHQIVAYALPDQNSIALGIRDAGWEGYFLSFGGRAVHITSKRCIPLWPAVAVVGYDL
ncbi:hypothetical protein FKG94_27440 [Exilibacterium tricleocarpae]|uniref:Uncharacterized protein n=1 Tax=Exilibacterium tricleocarpae TaxID=2591008 RepID=A0A545SMC8_9GAMM|nr:hypothetical protein [Exilibacterium tricleocarpae]TQV66160.1 hypothetical protein FKG94_27440 [Exilibacterium tricleocarpae]